MMVSIQSCLFSPSGSCKSENSAESARKRPIVSSLFPRWFVSVAGYIGIIVHPFRFVQFCRNVQAIHTIYNGQAFLQLSEPNFPPVERFGVVAFLFGHNKAFFLIAAHLDTQFTVEIADNPIKSVVLPD